MRLISSIVELQRIVEGAMIRDGEVLIVGRNSNKDTRLIPYCIEVLQIDRLTTPMSEINNPRIQGGIEFDEEGAPLLYYVAKQHPGSGILRTMTKNVYEEIPAFKPNGTRKVLHHV